MLTIVHEIRRVGRPGSICHATAVRGRGVGPTRNVVKQSSAEFGVLTSGGAVKPG